MKLKKQKTWMYKFIILFWSTIFFIITFKIHAFARDSVLSCFTANGKEHVVIMGSGVDVRIQWNGGKFEYGTAEIQDEHFLLVQQFSTAGTFRMVYDANTGLAYGGTVFYNGKENKSAFNCRWQ